VAFFLLILNPSLKKEGLDEVYGNKPYFCPVTKSGDGVSWPWQIFLSCCKKVVDHVMSLLSAISFTEYELA
jgi:hypothetical protein